MLSPNPSKIRRPDAPIKSARLDLQTLRLDLFSNDFYDQFPLARPIKFTEENSLPATQRQPAILDEHDLRTAYER